jgi:hypothetical protein
LLNCTQVSSRKFSIQMYPLIELTTSIKRSRSASAHPPHNFRHNSLLFSHANLFTSTSSRPSCPRCPFPPTRDRNFCGNSTDSKSPNDNSTSNQSYRPSSVLIRSFTISKINKSPTGSKKYPQKWTDKSFCYLKTDFNKIAN